MADNQNKAIFVFTGVTIVFLPLSFFTSYYGMNLKGILNSSRTEADFWKICGSSAFVIILIVCLYAFRYHIRQIIWASLQEKRVDDG
jgi:Mg2+ and Co2+ transporter CorA